MTQVPPTRWKVVERGRRLEVIDTRAGERAGAAPKAAARAGAKPAAAPGSPHVWLRKVSFDGTSEMTTHPLYDDHGPRTITLDPASARIVGAVLGGSVLAGTALIVGAVFWPAILLVLLPLAQDKARAPARRAITAWLDARQRGS